MIISKYESKMFNHGLVTKRPYICTVNEKPVWNIDDETSRTLGYILEETGYGFLIFGEPAEPFFSVINSLCSDICGCVVPEDSETRTFLHEIPVVDRFDLEEITSILKKRKAVVIKNRGIITYGTHSAEQSFVVFSSVIFSLFVRYFSDIYKQKLYGSLTMKKRAEALCFLNQYKGWVPDFHAPEFLKSPYENGAAVKHAMMEAGKATVDFRMVDSFFGNVSCLYDNAVYISQTGSSLDELGGFIDVCPIDGSSSEGITASSELSAHSGVYELCDVKTILHGHPRFSVIMSLCCDVKDCENSDACFYKCTKERFVGDVPVVPGEVGTGVRGISRTLPKGISGKRGCIVYGHGVFTTGKNDFYEAFKNLYEIEQMCLERYEKLITE